MNNILSVPEINIVNMFTGETKADTIINIMGAVPHITDKEMKNLMEQTIITLDKMPDSEYDDCVFIGEFGE